jgi:hypothetical protein
MEARTVSSLAPPPIVSQVLPIDAAAQAYLPVKKTHPGKTVLQLFNLD